MSPRVLAVTGLTKEARLVSGPGMLAIAGGGSRVALEARLLQADLRDVRAIVSFGIAGALHPESRVGDVVLATAIRDGATIRAAATSFIATWSERLEGEGITFRQAAIAGVDAPLLRPADKASLRASSEAAAVDMESHIAAEFAARHRLPFGAIRVISDEADRTLPPIAGTAMRPDGSVDVIGVMRDLARHPGQIPALLATARDAAVAFRVLRRVRGLPGDLLGLEL